MDGVVGGEYGVRRVLPPETWGIRASVLWPEKEADDSCALEVDGDPGVLHFGVIFNDEVVGIGSFMPQKHRDLEPSIGYRLRAMASHANHRGKGVATLLIRHAESVLKNQGEGGVWADARKGALGFYAGLGWEVSGAFYSVPKRGPHRLVWTRFGE